MVVNEVILDPRSLNFVYCFTDDALPLDSIITVNSLTAIPSKVYTSNEGFDPGVSSATKGLIGFNYLNTGYTFGDTFVIVNSSFSLPVSGYSSAGYGYLNFTSDRANSGSYYPGSNIYANQNYLNVGTNDFTIEFIAYLTTTDTFQTFVSFEGVGSFPGFAKLSIVYQSGCINVYRPGFNNANMGGCSLEANTWYHIAVVRSSGVLSLYVDGVLQVSTAWTYDYSDITITRFGVIDVNGFSGLTTIFGLSGSLCNIRITANEALYTDAFTPPSLPLTAGANTTVLMLADSDANKYVNSIDNVVFTNVNNPTTNEPVTYSAGPIPYPPPPPPPPNYDVFWTPDTETLTWCSGYNSGTCNYNVNVFDFNNSIDRSQVRSFNISSINSLTGLEFIVNLESFVITSYDNTFTSYDVSTGPSSLSAVYVNAYYLTSITGLTSLPNLRELDVHSCSISNINVTPLTGLTLFNINGQHAPLNNLTVSANTALQNLNIGNNALTSIDISNNINLTYLAVGNDPMQTYNTNFSVNGVDISNNSLLTIVNVNNCNLTATQADSIIINLNNFGLQSGTLNFSNNNGRTSASDAAYAALQSKFWTIYS